MGRGSRKPLLKEIPFDLTFLHFHQKLNSPSILQKKSTYKFPKSPSIFKRNPIKKIAFNFIWKILLNFSKNHKLETIFEKSHRSIVILKIVEASPQLVQNLTPIRKLLCTFLYLYFLTLDPTFNIS